MPIARSELRRWPSTAAVLLAAVAVVLVQLVGPKADRAAWGDAAVAAAAVVAGSVVLLTSRRHPVARGATLPLGLGLLGLALVPLLFLAHDLGWLAGHRPGPVDLAFLALAGPLLIPMRAELASHFLRDDRREVAADVALLAAALACIVFLFLRPDWADLPTTISSAAFAILAVVGFVAYGTVALWVPSLRHVIQVIAVGALSAAALRFGWVWVREAQAGGDPLVALPFALGGLLLAAKVTLLPARGPGEAAPPSTWGRPLLTTAAVVTASTALALVATRAIEGRLAAVQGPTLIAILAAAVALRILVNQLRSTEASGQARRALVQKESALAEADLAVERLRRVNETLQASEEHLRLVFDAAVDGIVELDERDVILHANEAFCHTVGLPRDMVEGQPWTALAAAVEGGGDSFASLPHTGQGTLVREGQTLHFESRISAIPTSPPRRLLLVRDITAASVADQTIRTLFKFLQDRDEDRTRIMQRTNAAIETERNRIARDLHDGPVQGVSAASLSLEAALLMIRVGDLEEGLDVLNKVRAELSEEADNLRRLMSGLRPPLLEERGLIPALRETLARFSEEQGIEIEFQGGVTPDLPPDLETLAYRVVQEALANAAKHAAASSVAVSVEADAGQLRLEVVDDGDGFDIGKSREYLRQGRVGLASMRERVELANGTFMVHSARGRGTTVVATLPLEGFLSRRALAAEA